MDRTSEEVSIVGHLDNRRESKARYYYGAGVASFLSIALCVVALAPGYFSKRPYVLGQVICSSKSCEAASGMLKRSVNEELDPCDDFYAFVCDGWMKAHKLRAHESQRSVFGEVDERVRDLLHHSLFNATLVRNESGSGHNALAVLYKACLQSLTPEGNGVVSLKRFLRHLGMSWPDADNHQNATDILETLVNLSMTWNVDVLFSYSVKSLSKTKGAIVLGPPAPLITGELTDAKKVMYAKLVVSMAFLFGRRNDYEEFAKSIVAIEADIARLRVQERTSVTFMVQELGNLCAEFRWQKWMLALNKNLPTTAALTPQKTVIVQHPAYIGRLLTYFLDHESPGDIKAYLALRVVLRYGQTTYDVRRLEEIVTRTSKGILGQNARKTCQQWVSRLMLDAWNSFVTTTIATRSTLHDLATLVGNIKQVFVRRIQSVSWMDVQTKNTAALKSNNIAFNTPVLNPAVDKTYANLPPLKGDFLDMVFTVVKSSITDSPSSSLSQIIDHSDAATVHSEANAMYVYSLNAVNVNAALLVFPFYVEGLPPAMNYGGIGAIVAHEIIHGFDVSGRLYDDVGGFEDWWTNATSAGYRESAFCFIEQMQALAHSPGSLTLEENVADNGGLRCAYNAYMAASSAAPTVVELKGLQSFEDDQLFFINYCYKFCGTARQEKLGKHASVSPYPLEKFRCNVPIMNFPEFATAFDCEPGSTMNPSERCTVW